MAAPEKKVLFLVHRPSLGGASQAMLNLLQVTRESKKFSAIFLFNEMGPALHEYQLHGSVHVFGLEKRVFLRRVLRRISLRLYDYIKYWYARRVIISHAPNLLYINSLAFNPAVRAALRSSVPLCLHAHEMDFLVTFKLSDAWVRSVLDRVDRLVACSNAVATFYEHTYSVSPTKISVIHGPVSSEILLKKAEKLPLLPRFHGKTVVIGTVANLSFLKAPDTIIEAMYILINKYTGTKQVRFEWLGAPTKPNPYFSSMQALVKERGLENFIRFLPASAQTNTFYSGIDIFVLPSRTEAFPLSILEAMLFEKPVVAMDVGGIREVVDLETGYLVKDRTPEGLAEGILYFLGSKERRKEAGRRGRQRVLENFEAEIQAPKWLTILHNS